MTPERRQRIEDLYRAARESAPADRIAFLIEACGTDSELRREVESRLGGRVDHGTKPGIGAQIGPYLIETSIGKGGMGEVWKARDPRLNRDVAIKISAQQFTDRFEREARAIAALNHSNICTLYDIGPNYLVMELVEGPTLAQRIAGGPIPIEESVNIAKQIANALEAAHEKGIIHRDLKPANIKIRPDGSVKVLDFGLAKASETDSATPDSPTITMTTPGTIMGTPGYMAPEQVRGEKVDKRADIWAFAVVLFEMVAGRRPFEGKSSPDMMAAILKEEPDWKRAPVRLHPLLRWCLEKDPRLRLRDIGDARRLLAETPPAPVSPQSRRSNAAWIAAGVFALAAAAIAFLHFRETPAQSPLLRLSITPPEKTHLPDPDGMMLAVSPDGTQVVFTALSPEGKNQLWLRSLGSATAQPLAGVENATFPFWSPDSKSIGLFAAGKLKKMDIASGLVTLLADASTARGGTWNEDGTILFAPTPYEFQQVSASGGAAHPVPAVGAKATARRFPWFLPDGNHFLYLYGSGGREYTVRIGSLRSPSDDRALPGNVDGMALYSAGHLLFVHGNTLVARPFDLKQLAFTGDAVPVAGQIQSGGLVEGASKISVSRNGVLVYRNDPVGLRLTWFDRVGRPIGALGEAGDLSNVRLSPDHRTIAVNAREASGGSVDIWLYDALRGLPTRFTSNAGNKAFPVWSPDGRTIVYYSAQLGHNDLYRKPADGSGKEELLYATSQHKTPWDFSPDGKFLAFDTLDPTNGLDLWILPNPLGAPGASKPYPFLRTEFNEQRARFSPDGHWIAYESNESDRYEVYVTKFPGPGGRKQVSAAGGVAPRWRPDGRGLFYVAPDNRLMTAELDTKGGTVEVKKVEALFGPVTNSYDVSADGQKFLVLVQPAGETGGPLMLVQNWTGGLTDEKK
jgi:serine/threonine protein kinase